VLLTSRKSFQILEKDKKEFWKKRDTAFVVHIKKGVKHFHEFGPFPYSEETRPARKIAAVGQMESAMSRYLGRQHPCENVDPLSSR
jgi:hypothetical protein